MKKNIAPNPENCVQQEHNFRRKAAQSRFGSGFAGLGIRNRESGLALRSGMVIGCLILVMFIMGISLTGCGGGGGDNGGPSPINNAIGIGVVIQSKSDLTANSIGNQSFNLAWKQIDITPGIYSGSEPSTRVIQAAGLDLTGKVALILLAWDKVGSADHYQVFYLETKVWDSAAVDAAKDPAFQANSPQAYLDFDDELKNITLTAGQYAFQVKALSGNTVVAKSSVTASLGRILQSLPMINDFTTTKPNLSWSPVTGVSEYRINISGINPVTVSSNTNSYNISTLLSAADPINYYDVYLDARAFDDDGKLLEITRGIGGLSY